MCSSLSTYPLVNIVKLPRVTAALNAVESHHRIATCGSIRPVARHPIPRQNAAQLRSLSEATKLSNNPERVPCLGVFLWRQHQRQSDFSFCVECLFSQSFIMARACNSASLLIR